MIIALIALAGVATAIGILVWYANSLGAQHEPRHAIGTETGPRHARAEFADPADQHDPQGDAWLAALRDAGIDPAPVLPPVAPPLGTPWYAAPAPVHHEAAPQSLALLARAGLPAAGMATALPEDPPPAETVRLPVAVCELAGLSTEEYVDMTFAEAEAEVARMLAGIGRAAEEESEAAA